ncbi:MAG: TonB-dependent receptor [Thalassolituus sp.]|nr:MAG: TonB-dependent receptor [Thalassolituus sp.]TNC92669.1 MAG: TonB-dependent receptor [Thalassolituus sp.]
MTHWQFRTLVLASLIPALASANDPDPAKEYVVLDNVYITGGEDRISQQPGSATLLGEEALEKFEYTDIHRILNSVPGVNLQEEDGYGLRPNIGLRGTAPERSKKVTLMEDGVLSGPAPYSAPAAYYFPNVSRMSAVEVFKGPSSIQYGPATIGGAVNMISRPVPEITEGQLDAQYGSDNFNRLSAWYGGNKGSVGYLIEGLRVASDGFKELDGGGDTGFTRNDLNLKLAWQPDSAANHRFVLKVGYADENSDETYLGLTRDDFDADPYRRYAASALDEMEWTHNTVHLTHQADLDDIHLTTDVYRLTFDRDWFKLNSFGGNGPLLQDVLKDPTGINTDFYRVLTGEQASANQNEQLLIGSNDRQYISQGVQTRLNTTLDLFNLEHDLELGVRYHTDQVERLHSEAAYDMTASGNLAQAGSVTTTLDNRGEAQALAIYALNNIRWDITTLTLGLRSEHIETSETTFDNVTGNEISEVSSGESVLLPGAGVYSQLTDTTGILAGVYKGYSATTPGKDGETDPEESTNYELGTRYNGDMGKAELIAFLNDYTDLTGTCSFSNGCDNTAVDSQLNAGAAQVYGIEASWSKFLFAGAHIIPLSMTYTYSQGEFAANFSDDNGVFGDRNNDIQKGDEIAYLPEHRLNLQAGVERGPVALNLSMLYQSDIRDTPGVGAIPEDERIDAYTVFDLSLQYRVIRDVMIYGTVDNLLGEEYEVASKPYGYRPGKPRSINAGVKVNF